MRQILLPIVFGIFLVGIVIVPQADAIFISSEDILNPTDYVDHIAIDSNDNIYLSAPDNAGGNLLKKYDKNGQFVWEIEIFKIRSLHIKSDVIHVCGQDTGTYVDGYLSLFEYSTEGNLINDTRDVFRYVCEPGYKRAVDSTGKSYALNFTPTSAGNPQNVITVWDTYSEACKYQWIQNNCYLQTITFPSGDPYGSVEDPNKAPSDWTQLYPYMISSIRAMDISDDGFIYLGGLNYPFIYKYTLDGTFVKRWLHEQVIDGVPQNECVDVRDLWVSQDGNIVVTGKYMSNVGANNYCNIFGGQTQLITKYSPDGDYIIGFDPIGHYQGNPDGLGYHDDKTDKIRTDNNGNFLRYDDQYLDRIHAYSQNDPPSVSDIAAITNEEESVQIQLAATDIQSTQPLSFVIIDDPSHGSLSDFLSINVSFDNFATVQNGKVMSGCERSFHDQYDDESKIGRHTGACGAVPPITYTPDLDYFGPDSFTFKANDGFEYSTTATVNITVNPVDDAPITADKSDDPFLLDRLAVEDVPENITLIGTDVDGDTISYIIVDQPLHGTLTGTPPNLIYTPNADYNGADSFQYKVNDGLLDGSTETVSISISPVNDIPVANAGSNQSVDPGSVVQLDGSQSLDVDGDTITYSWIQTAGYPVTLTADNIASPQFTAPSQGGQLTFMLTLNDGIATSSPNVVNIYVGESIPEPTAPPAPGSVASSTSDSQVTLTWSPPSDDGGSAITDYLVEYATADSGTWLAYDDGTSTTTSATITGLSNGQEYNFRISAVNSEGIGDASGSVDATPSLEPVEPEIIPEEPEPVMDIQPDAEPEMTSEAVPAFEPEPKSEAVQSSAGCGAGTVMVNGVCQVAKTSGTSMAIEPMYIVIAAVAIGGGAVGALFALKRGSGTPKPAREELEEYESKYVARKPAEKKETSEFCENCGKKLKTTAKFCGGCGTKV